MRIDLNSGNVESVGSSATRRTHEGAKELKRTSKQDDAVLSSGDSNVSKLTAEALAVPEVRTERVAELRSSISNGSYSIDPGAIANALLNDLF
jgi:flagellar biosynthesis anti-sigma factor FlgM